MSDLHPLKDLLDFTRDGEWGKGGPGSDLVEMAVIRGTDFASVRRGDISTVPRRFIPEGAADRKALMPGDLLIETAGGTKDQPTGRTVYLSERIFDALPVPVTCASFSRFLRVNRELVNPRYLFWYLQSIYSTGEMLPYHIQHTGVARFQYTDFASQWLVPVPPLDKQAKIAETLSVFDDKIALNRRMNETLEAMARALFKDWFVDFGPTRAKIEGRDPYLASEIWDLFPDKLDEDGKPVEWKNAPLKEFFSIIGGGTPKTSVEEYWDGEIPWFSVVDTPPKGSVFVTVTDKSITERGLEESSARLIPEGTTIISARGTVGNLAMAAQEMAFNQSCYALRANDRTGDCSVYLAAQHMMAQLQSMAHGSVFSTITRQTFEAVSLPMPSHAVTQAFEAFVEPLFLRIKSNVIETTTLAQARDLLLPKLISGEIRVGDADKFVQEFT